MQQNKWRIIIISTLVILLVFSLLIYNLYSQNIFLINQNKSLYDQNESLTDLYHKLIRKIELQDILSMPKGLDQHYEKIRNASMMSFVNKAGDWGWLLFTVGQVLHDTGQYNWSDLCVSFNKTHGVTCSNLTLNFLERITDYISKNYTGLEKIRVLYLWVNDYIGYIDNQWGFPRFPIETLVYGFGDCEDQAMVMSALLEFSGFETALSLIHDEEKDLYHEFCLVKANGMNYNGTLLQLDEYTELGHCWFILDPAYNQEFGKDPDWIEKYKNEKGSIQIPKSVWNTTVVSLEEFTKIKDDLGIP